MSLVNFESEREGGGREVKERENSHYHVGLILNSNSAGVKKGEAAKPLPQIRLRNHSGQPHFFFLDILFISGFSADKPILIMMISNYSP